MAKIGAEIFRTGIQDEGNLPMQTLKNLATRPLVAVLALLLILGGGFATSVALGAEVPAQIDPVGVFDSGDGDDGEDSDVPITGEELEKASAAALEYLGEGTVTDSEVGDEEGYYEIEVTLDSGQEVDVHLDENFTVLGTELEDEDDENDD